MRGLRGDRLAIAVWGRPAWKWLVDPATGRASVPRSSSQGDAISGIGRRVRGRLCFVYVRADLAGAPDLVVQQGRSTVLARSATAQQKDRGTLVVSDGTRTVVARDRYWLRRVFYRMDAAAEDLEDEDFLDWVRRVVEDPDLRAHLGRTWTL